MRLAVPFGKSKIYTALVIDTSKQTRFVRDAKEIHQILEEQPIVTEIQIALEMDCFLLYVPLAMYIEELCRGVLESETVISQKTNTIADTSLL
jgi:primosomal protein N' (replication factor Y)